MDDLHLRYPIGKFAAPDVVDRANIETCIHSIASLPGLVRETAESITAARLNTPYRPGGWTSLQVVHHLADSHMNAFIRFKLSLTENSPTIKPYEEALWAAMPDATEANLQSSLSILDGLHARWVLLLNNMQVNDFNRTFYHPEQQRHVTLGRMVNLYAWHGRHHLEHIRMVR